MTCASYAARATSAINCSCSCDESYEPMTAMRLLPAILCVLALPAAAFAAPKDIKPYKTFRFEYTSTKPDTRTGFRYDVALDLPADGSQPPVIQ